MTPEAAKLLWDIATATERVARFTAGRGFADHLADDHLRSAVERQFEIAGEALGALRRRAPEIAARIPQHPRMIAFRNVLIHGYAGIDDTLVRGVVERDVPPLRAAIAALLDEA
jgi:uncharacterized protein with HEPN domain